MKKTLLSLIALFITTIAFASVEIDGIYYNLINENKTAEVIPQYRYSSSNYSGVTTLTIPSSVTYNSETYNVTSIGYGAFKSCSSLTSISIPNSVTSIGNYAFSSCSSLTSITIPNSVTSIGNSAFENCSSLTSITIPNSVTEIGGGAFNGCSSLTSISIPNSVTSIGNSAFSSCRSLTSITIPNSVIYLGNEAFANCMSLRYVKLGSGFRSNKYDDEEEPYSYLGSNLFYFEEGYGYIDRYTENEKYVWISHPLDTLICEFIDCELDESGGMGFDDDGLLQNPLNTTKNLRYFQGPAKLVNTITEEYQTHFTNKLTEIHITDGELDENGFNFINRSKKSLHTIDLAGATNTAINDLVFYDCYKLENLIFPKNVETIGYKAFADCKHLTALTIPASVTEIGESAFENCRSINTLTFEEGSALESIGSWAFYNNHNLVSVEIPEGVKEIGDAAFYGCTYMEEIVIPASVERIGDNGFALCNQVKRMEVRATTPPTIEAKTFHQVSRDIDFIVPVEARNAYAQDEYWREFIQEAPTNVENTIEGIEIYTQNGTLHLEGLTADYQIYNTSGLLIYSGNASTLSLPRGIYLVTINGETQKIVL